MKDCTYQNKHTDDTIVAVATPLGVGGVGVIRLSGPLALVISAHITQKTLSFFLSCVFGSIKFNFNYTIIYNYLRMLKFF